MCINICMHLNKGLGWAGLNLRSANVLNIVVGATIGLVDGLAGRAVLVLGSVGLRDGARDAARQGDLLVDVVGPGAAREPVREQNQLAVAVPVDIQLEALALSELVRQRPQAEVLGCVAGLLPPVRLGARAGRGSVAVPLVWPVAVDVGADGARSRSRLPVLAPKTIGGLGVDETCSC